MNESILQQFNCCVSCFFIAFFTVFLTLFMSSPSSHKKLESPLNTTKFLARFIQRFPVNTAREYKNVNSHLVSTPFVIIYIFRLEEMKKEICCQTFL